MSLWKSRILVATLLCAVTVLVSSGQTQAWSRSDINVNIIGGTNAESIDSTAIDASGNVYVAGTFEGTVDVDPGPGIVSYTTAGSRDVFVSKFRSNGDLIWAKHFDGTGDDDLGGVAVDAAGNVVVTGGFNGTMDLDPGAATHSTTSSGYTDGYVVKLDSTGSYIWSNTYGCGAGAYLWMGKVAVDSQNRITMIGGSQCDFDFDSGSGVMSMVPAGGFDGFIGQMDSAGHAIWLRTVGGTGDDFANHAAFDSNGDVVTVGGYDTAFDADPGAGTTMLVPQDGGGALSDVFIVKYNASGGFVWAKSVGGVGDDFASDVAFGPTGEVYIGGGFDNAADFDPGPGVNAVSPTGEHDAFVLKLTSSGSFSWVRTVGGTANDVASGVAVTPDSVYVTGEFRGTADLDPSPDSLNFTANNKDAFIMRLATNGTYVWSKVMNGAGAHYANGVATTSNGTLVMYGQVWSDTNFNLNGESMHYSPSDDYYDAYFMTVSNLGVNLTTSTSTSTTTTTTTTSTVAPVSANISTTSVPTPITPTTIAKLVQPVFTLKTAPKTSSVARFAGLVVSSGAKVTVVVSASSAKVCAVKAGKLVALKKGTCSMSVTVSTTSKGKTSSKRASTKLTVS